ncbi:hypothetical protein [Geothrix oryzisoli]|uniref:hypothetical protein n=1 Tax=Geothrix oryzisoli TaxID=2922721 RepID=UPI001FACAA57|nr:hypothetical protein [Geothrix oryzisoli]
MSALDAFRRTHGEITWDDIVTGHDFGFLEIPDIQAWVPGEGTAAARLKALQGEALRTFEAHLWAACAEAVGKTPRPGSTRWSQAQDRWREAVLREALAVETTAPRLAAKVERLYDQVGCPEDMLGMLRPSQRWSGLPATVDPQAVQQFLERIRRTSSDRSGSNS